MKKLIQIAISKTISSEELDFLNEISKLAETLDTLESNFEERITSNKALRGEKPTVVTRSKKKEINQYKSDADDLTNQLAKDFILMENAKDIIRAIRSGFDGDISFWKQAVKYTHPADMSIVEEFLSAKIKLREALIAYLNHKSG
ncbi:MAG: hypothetical protein HY881_13400 [Deltaproteobacteria bacterium]|nr:hypothetical protein [Deltaproteobacteria bacterium]